ncbi:potassium channel family protein [Ekhidna sp.]
MKFIVVGLGNFGSTLALKLAEDGHDVIGVDHNESLINSHKEKLTHTLKMDSTSELAVNDLPLDDTEAVVIAIGQDANAAITTAALFKKRVPTCRIVARATSDIHRTIFEAMDIEETVNPEAEYAEQFAHKLTITGEIKSYFLDEKYEIAEFKVPTSFLEKKVSEVDLVSKWNLSLVTIIRPESRKNLIGKEISQPKVIGPISGNTEFQEKDTLVLFGLIKDLEKMTDEIGEE